jgi:hypothetical protein
VKRVHTAASLIDAQLAADLLASLGIPNHIFNVNAVGAMGEVPFMHAQPEIWVEDDTQASRAREILAGEAGAAHQEERDCPHCNEPNPGHFLTCWHCGSALPG